MPTPNQNRTLLPTDVLYLLTFAAGMAFFWGSGHVARFVPLRAPHLAQAVLAVTALVYGLGIAIIAWLTTKSARSVGAGMIIAVVLGLVAAQVVFRTLGSHIHTKQDFTILTFVLYLLYGGIYVLGLAVARRLRTPAKQSDPLA